MEIKSTYNFVPLSEEVFFPEWAKQISHDIPFSDAESGTIKLRLKAESDIFIRNAEFGKDSDPNFSNFKNRPFIPATSIKGALRSVLQILSFSKINQVENVRYSVRDLNDVDVFRGQNDWNKVRGGWLRKVGDNYFLTDCGVPGRIAHKEIDKYFKSQFSTIYRGKDKIKYNPTKEDHKSARHKYKLAQASQIDLDRSYAFSFLKEDVMRMIYSFSSGTSGSDIKNGKIVFTGQPSPRKEKEETRNNKAQGKQYEFIFWNTSKEEKEVKEELMDDFFFTYYEHDAGRRTEDYKYWRRELKANRKIPVFFSEDNMGNILHLGLSYMYKLPYKYKVHDAIPDKHKRIDADLTECMFGYTNLDGQSLKGRVQIGHAFAVEKTTPKSEQSEILGGPKASYYPFYLENSGQKFGTYHDQTAKIRGYKRYPVRSTLLKNQNPDASEKVFTKFIPLAEGAIFELDINVHNLRNTELGALLSTITFHAHQNFYHSIGMGKPLGYGRCTFEIVGLENFRKQDPNHYICAFEQMMNSKIPNWITQDPITELFTLSQLQGTEAEKRMDYPKLKNSEGGNDFVQIKKDKKPLSPFSQWEEVSKAVLKPIENCENSYIPDTDDNPDGKISLLKIELERKIDKEYQNFFEQKMAEIDLLISKADQQELEAAAQERKDNAELDLSEAISFKKLDSVINVYLKKILGNNYDKQLKKGKIAPPILPESEHENLKKTLFTLRSDRELNKGKTFDKSHEWSKKIATWVGKEKALTFYNEWIALS